MPTFVLAICVVATLAGARNYREIATVAEGICQCQLRVLGAEWDYFGKRYKCPRRTTIWYVLARTALSAIDLVSGRSAVRIRSPARNNSMNSKIFLPQAGKGSGTPTASAMCFSCWPRKRHRTAPSRIVS